MGFDDPVLLLVLLTVVAASVAGPVAAHETAEVEGYEVTFGGADEPLITGERMWLEFEIADNETGEPVENQSETLAISVQSAGNEKTSLNVSEKHGEPGVYEAPVIFTEPGEYTVHLEGSLGGTDVHTHFEKEVHDRTDLEYPGEQVQSAENESDTDADENETEESGFGAVGVAVVALGVATTVGIFLVRQRR